MARSRRRRRVRSRTRLTSATPACNSLDSPSAAMALLVSVILLFLLVGVDEAGRARCRVERGGLVPSLKQFMELVDFYTLQTEDAPPAARYQGVAAMVAALSSPAYHLPEAMDLIKRLQPAPAAGRRRRKR